MVDVDTHLARGASNRGRTFHDRGGPYGRTKGAKHVVAIDVTGLGWLQVACIAATLRRISQTCASHRALGKAA